MTDNFEKDINVPSKEIIIKFSDGYCIVLENNEVSIRENYFTKYQIVFGKRTNELLEFVKELYLNKKAKEQECKKYKQALDEIEINISKYQGLTFGKPRTMRENDCIYKILNIINEAKEQISD